MFRSIRLRYALTVLLLPGYLGTLGAEQRADGLFDRWFSLTMPFHFAEDIQQDIKIRVQHVGTVSEALETASEWAVHHSEQDDAPDQRTHQPLFSLLIGEWKQFRQVNSSATPIKLPEWRELKYHTRSLTALFTVFSLGFESISKGFGPLMVIQPVFFDTIFLPQIPLISGIAIAAP